MTENQISDGGEVIINKKPLNLGPVAIGALIFGVIFVFAVGVGLAVALFYPRTGLPQTTTKSDPLPENNRVLPVQPNPNPKAVPIISDINAWLSEIDNLDLDEPQLTMPDLDLKIAIPVE